MQRDMELIRKILFMIEDKYIDTWLSGNEIAIDGYDMKTVAYHCAILYDAGLIHNYEGNYSSNELQLAALLGMDMNFWIKLKMILFGTRRNLPLKIRDCRLFWRL